MYKYIRLHFSIIAYIKVKQNRCIKICDYATGRGSGGVTKYSLTVLRIGGYPMRFHICKGSNQSFYLFSSVQLSPMNTRTLADREWRGSTISTRDAGARV